MADVDIRRRTGANVRWRSANGIVTGALARQRRLELARDETAAWSRVEAVIATRKPAEYDAVVTLLIDLQALAERDGYCDTFTLRTTALRQTPARKPSLIERLDRVGI
jgi:hypothetical protein